MKMNDATFESQKDMAVAIGIEVQQQLAQEVIEIRTAVQTGDNLQSWPIALGEPDAQQYRSGVQRFGARWYLTSDPSILATLQAGCAALSRLQGAIQSQCNAAGIDIAFTNAGRRIRIPAPDLGHRQERMNERQSA